MPEKELCNAIYNVATVFLTHNCFTLNSTLNQLNVKLKQSTFRFNNFSNALKIC